MSRSAQLDTLAVSLMELTEVLSLDPRCQWRRHFEQCLSTTRQLRATEFSQNQLNELSGSVRSVFGGMGSFNDYAPVAVAQGGSVSVIRGMERLDQIAGQVHESALALMVVEGNHAL